MMHINVFVQNWTNYITSMYALYAMNITLTFQQKNSMVHMHALIVLQKEKAIDFHWKKICTRAYNHLSLPLLTQVEEMLIFHANQILQVMHAHGGHYKYSGHTICLPQDISNIATSLPHPISNLDILVVHKCNPINKLLSTDLLRQKNWILTARI